MTTMVRERSSLAASPVVFLAVTPEIRRALALLAEAAIDLMDEIDRPVEELEPDPDAFEDDDPAEEDDAPEEDDFCEDIHDAEPEEGDADLGWTEGGVIGMNDAGYDSDIVEPDTSSGFRHNRVDIQDPQRDAVLRAMFDPRLALRPPPPEDVMRTWRVPPPPPAFPHEPPGRPRFDHRDEMRRIAHFAATATKRLRSNKK